MHFNDFPKPRDNGAVAFFYGKGESRRRYDYDKN
jgi:hypothetical protein